MILLLVFGCRTAEVVDACDLGEDACPVCSTDAECGYTGNACTEWVYCAHQDAAIPVEMIGCSEAMEYTWPEAGTCVCRDQRCTAE